jgi:hypothetical protein
VLSSVASTFSHNNRGSARQRCRQLVYCGLTLLHGATIVNKTTVVDLPAINIELVINDARLMLMASTKVADGIVLRCDNSRERAE